MGRLAVVWTSRLSLEGKILNSFAVMDCCKGILRSRDSSVVRAPDLWSKGCGFESLLERRENLFSRVNFLCWLLFRYPFHPRVTAVARERPWLFYQKCRWQVTAKHAYTLRMWLCMKWHSAWLHGVHRTRLDGSSCMWHQPCQHCKYTTLVDIEKRTIKSCSLM